MQGAGAGRDAVDMSRPRVFLVDDSPLLRETIRLLLEEEDTGISVVGEASSAVEALAKIPVAAALAPVVVLMDVRMPGEINGIEATRRLWHSGAHVEIVVLTGFPERAILDQAKRAGAVATIVKGGPREEIIGAIDRAWSVLLSWVLGNGSGGRSHETVLCT